MTTPPDNSHEDLQTDAKAEPDPMTRWLKSRLLAFYPPDPDEPSEAEDRQSEPSA